jgi:molybdate transport system permease protein
MIFRSSMVFISLLFFSFIFLLIAVITIGAFPALNTKLISGELFISSILISLRTSIVATGLAAVIGTPTAYILTYYSFRGKRILDTLIELPIVLPPLVLGLSILIFTGANSLFGTFFDNYFPLLFTERGIIAAQFIVASPLYIRTLRESMAKIPEELLRASDSLQADETHRFFNLILPLSKSGIGAGVTLTLARSLGEFGATAMVAGSVPGKTETLTLAIYRNAASGKTDEALLGSLILILISISVMITVKWRFNDGTYR